MQIHFTPKTRRTHEYVEVDFGKTDLLLNTSLDGRLELYGYENVTELYARISLSVAQAEHIGQVAAAARLMNERLGLDALRSASCERFEKEATR
jgi:hypothetical protein